MRCLKIVLTSTSTLLCSLLHVLQFSSGRTELPYIICLFFAKKMSFFAIAIIFGIFHINFCLAAVEIQSTSTRVEPVEKSCSETNVTIDEVQFQHVWDLHGLPSYMSRLDQWKPFIELETKDVRFSKGVIGGTWNFQVVRNPGSGSRLTLCAIHTPEHRKPNPHDKNFFFEFKVLVALVPPPVAAAVESKDGSTTTTSTTTEEPNAPPEAISSTTEAPPPPSSSSTADSTSPSTAEPPLPSSSAEDSNSIQQQRSLYRSNSGATSGGFINRFFNTSHLSSPATAPIVLQFGYGGYGPSSTHSSKSPAAPGDLGRQHYGTSKSYNTTLASPTMQQSPISPKTHFTFWDFEAKTVQLLRAHYRNEPPPKDAMLSLTFSMTELIVEKPGTMRKVCKSEI